MPDRRKRVAMPGRQAVRRLQAVTQRGNPKEGTMGSYFLVTPDAAYADIQGGEQRDFDTLVWADSDASAITLAADELGVTNTKAFELDPDGDSHKAYWVVREMPTAYEIVVEARPPRVVEWSECRFTYWRLIS